jgi:hypothetical protein
MDIVIIIIIIIIITIIIIIIMVVIVAKLTEVFWSLLEADRRPPGHLHITDRKLCVRCHDVSLQARFLALVLGDR